MVDHDQNSGGLDSSNNVLQGQHVNNGNDKDSDENSSPPCFVVDDPRMLSTDGICKNCSAETKGEVVCCYECKNNFHATCNESRNGKRVNLPDNVCSPSLLVSLNKNTESKLKSNCSGMFFFHCKSCVTRENFKNAADVKTHVHALETKMTSMEADIITIKNLLLAANTGNTSSDVSKSAEVSATSSTPSSANFVFDNPWRDSKRVENLRHPASVIVCEDGETVPKPDLETIIKANNIIIDNTFTNRNGETVVTASSQADRVKLVEALTQRFPDSKLKQPKEKLPTVSISGIKEDIQPESLSASIMKLYPEIKSLTDSGETFSVISVRKQRNHSIDNPLFQASVRVSNSIRKLIENRDNYLSIGLYRCKVYDHFYVKRCNKCQLFGHYIAHCKASHPVCALCSDEHETNSCPNKGSSSFKPSCVNCKKSKRTDEQYTHSATDRTCPTYVSEQHKLKKSISYYTSKNW